MGRLNNTPLTRAIEMALEEEYQRALAYVAQYGSGLGEAQQAFARLQAYRRALASNTGRSGKAIEQPTKRAA